MQTDSLPNPFVLPSAEELAEYDALPAPSAGLAISESLQDAPPPVRPFTLWAPKEFLKFKPDPSACLLGDGYIERGEWTSLVGIGGLGKTRLALRFAVNQICGLSWCGLETRGTPQRTAIFSPENGITRWKSDLERIVATLDERQRAAINAQLRILALTPDEDGDLCLGNLETVMRLRATLASLNPGFVIFDPFADMVDGDENKTQDMVQTLRHLRSITRESCASAAVLIVHHARTGAGNVLQAGDLFNAGNFGRGAKALYARVRCELQLAPQDRDDPNRLVLCCGKANNAIKFAPRGLVFDPETFSYEVDETFSLDAWRDDVSGKRRQSTISIAEVVEAVREKAPFPGDETTTAAVCEILKDTGAPLRTIQRQLAAAVHTGYLRHGKKRGKWRLGSKPIPQ